jgi:hypothetical protein
VVLVVSALVLAGCTSSSGGGPTTPTGTVTHIRTPSPSTPRPAATGAVTAHPASSCRYATTGFVRDTVGMRLARITVLRRAGKTVGCRFYPLGHPNAQCDATCLQGEHLPAPNQPVVEIRTDRYGSNKDAHNEVARVGSQGTNPERVALGGGITGVCFQTAFYPKDHGTDWACAANVKATYVIVRTVVTSPALDAQLVTERVLKAIR